MDKINVTDDALQSADEALQRWSEEVNGITENCISTLSVNADGLDERFRKDIERYIKVIDELNKKISYFVEENSSCIRNRRVRVSEYEEETYYKRNIM